MINENILPKKYHITGYYAYVQIYDVCPINQQVCCLFYAKDTALGLWC